MTIDRLTWRSAACAFEKGFEMSRQFLVAILLGVMPSLAFAKSESASVVTDLKAGCTVRAPGPNQVKTCQGPAGYQAVMHQTPMGEQLTLENTAIAFSAAVLRCTQAQRITRLGWRTHGGKPFAAFIGYKCIGTKGQSAAGSSERILVQGLKGFEAYGHEVRAKNGRPTMVAAESLADGWLESK